ncbi:hydrogenase large subunit [Methanocella arvoryzae]|uniref:Hydrogenase, large subunit-like protein (HycE-like) n=1 Tax=Methanocella arvoryzae (strain DSM 22066 / NBRC 105507 / MRE50) TaxID=351160 RepID=Q0W2B9_METAR|nr:NADH-quinone oxidoreductase subunit C [Methanocella arvoryzae]CAJ37474.1 hydrogenase, large subunit-like protein (HycE-like) [Methanocella arvoryzae MRE50]
MTAKNITNEITAAFGEEMASARDVGNNVFVRAGKDALPYVASFVAKRYGASLATLHVADTRQMTGGYTMYAVMPVASENLIVSIEAEVPESPGTFQSLTPMIYSANWFEREIADMFGLTPVGHPDLRPLVLYDTWPEDYHPLRKDAPGRPPKVDTYYPYHRVEGEGVFEIPVGPVHAGVIEPGHFRFSVAGEPVLMLEIRMGYVHKGIEKISESMTYDKGVFLSERTSGDNGMAHSTAYCQAVEQLAGIEVPDRARYIRTVFLEMERIYNHLGDVGGISLDTAYNVGAQHAYILRERMLQLNECITGSRLLRSVNKIGGVRQDLTREDIEKIRTAIIKAKLDFKDFVDLVNRQTSILDRTETTGKLPLEAAVSLNIVGPGARASGVSRDVRRDHPYAAYSDLNFAVHIRKEGDVNARMQVKIGEIYESMSIIEQALDRLPAGKIRAATGNIPQGRVGISLVEAPRGELLHWILSGENDRPFRHKIRDPSFCNWLAMEIATPGNIVPDFPLVNKSFNLSYSGNDL